MSNYKFELNYNLKEIEKGKLYKSSQPDKKFLSYLKDSYGIKTIVSLRNKVDKEEAEAAKEKNISLVHIPLTPFSGISGEKASFFLRLFQEEKNLPVLLHCRRGKDRTNVMAAIFRTYYQNWPEKEVFKEINEERVNLYWKMIAKWEWKAIRKIKKNENLI
jgi:protein tyrosine/serine phosphatase